MTKSSVKVKYLSTIHPNVRDGLLKGKLEDLEDDESNFHNSPQEYFENKDKTSDEPRVDYNEEEEKEGFWNDLSLASFWSKYEIVYSKQVSNKESKKKTKIISLRNGKGFIRKRLKMAVLRYYLNYDNNEDLARGLLILFKAF